MGTVETLKAPFTDEQVVALNRYQEETFMHPFTCCSHDGCERHEREDSGMLIATNEGWVCPCGKWKQDWAHEFMLNKPVDPFAAIRDRMKTNEPVMGDESLDDEFAYALIRAIQAPTDPRSNAYACNYHKLGYMMWRIRNTQSRSYNGSTYGRQLRSRNRWYKV